MDEPMVDGGQPDQGQADAPSGGQPYADYLNRLPEEVRGDVEPVFQDWNKNVNSRFEQHASFRKQWEPYEKAGLNTYTADQLAWAVQTLQNPQQAREWLDQQYGPVQAPEPAQESLDPYGYQDPNQQLEQLLSSKLGPLEQQLQQFNDWRQQLEQQQMEQQIASALEAEVNKLREEHAAGLPKEVQENFGDIIERFGMRYAESGADPATVVQKAWADFQALQNQLTTAALQNKVDQPQAPVDGGVADLTPEKVNSLREANKIALQQMRANRAA